MSKRIINQKRQRDEEHATNGEHARLPHRRPHRPDTRRPAGRQVVVILSNVGLWLGREGLVDAYERSATTEIRNEALEGVRPDILHQCLLALFDSDIAQRGLLRVYLITVRGKVIEIDPSLRPPRTYHRFRGLMETLLRDGRIESEGGVALMNTLRGTIAPIIPHGAQVTALTNSRHAPIKGPIELAKAAIASPVPDDLQGGIKKVAAFYVVGCSDELKYDESTKHRKGGIGTAAAAPLDSTIVDSVTEYVCLSKFPATPHVLCSRITEAYGMVQ